jgi:hypothetical protein
MNAEVRRAHYGSVSAGFVLIAVAVAILLAWFLGDWVLFVPIVLIEWGGFGLVFGAMVGRSSEARGESRSASGYYILWSSLLLVIGLMWVANDLYPGNLPFLVAVFIIWLAVMIIALARR